MYQYVFISFNYVDFVKKFRGFSIREKLFEWDKEVMVLKIFSTIT